MEEDLDESPIADRFAMRLGMTVQKKANLKRSKHVIYNEADAAAVIDTIEECRVLFNLDIFSTV